MDLENTLMTTITPENTPIQIVPPNKKSKLPLILGIIILIGIVGGLGFLGGRYLPPTTKPIIAQPTISPIPTTTPDLSADWKTYINTKYGYSIKYPGNWKTPSGNDQDITVFTQTNPTTLHSFSVSVENQTFENLYQSVKLAAKSEINSFDLGLISAKKAIYSTGINDSDYVIDIIFQKNEKVFRIQASFINPPDQTEIQEYDQILSTFKLLNAQIDTNTPGKENNFSGLLRKTTSRPTPDIAYDYEIILDQPLTGITTGAGDNQTLTKIIAVSTNINLESYVGKQINFTASLDWGYAESKVFNISKIIQPN